MRHDFGGNVVSLAERAAPVIFPAISQVDAYWEGLRNGRLMPERAEVDPRGLENALEFTFMLEHVAPGVARFRIAGMHLNDLLGMEVRGMPASAFFEPADRARFGQVLDRVIATPQVADLRLSGKGGIGLPAITARLYLAPLSNGGRGHPRILGCLQSIGPIGRAPRRFGIDHIHQRRIVGAAAAPKPAVEFAEDPVDFVHQPAEHSERPHLRLVKSDE